MALIDLADHWVHVLSALMGLQQPAGGFELAQSGSEALLVRVAGAHGVLDRVARLRALLVLRVAQRAEPRATPSFRARVSHAHAALAPYLRSPGLATDLVVAVKFERYQAASMAGPEISGDLAQPALSPMTALVARTGEVKNGKAALSSRVVAAGSGCGMRQRSMNRMVRWRGAGAQALVPA